MWFLKVTPFILIAALFPVLAYAGVIDEAKPLTESLLDILNFLLSIVGVIAIIGLVIAGVLYFTAHGDERQVSWAKRSLVSGIIGIVIALGGMVLVWTIATLLAG